MPWNSFNAVDALCSLSVILCQSLFDDFDIIWWFVPPKFDVTRNFLRCQFSFLNDPQMRVNGTSKKHYKAAAIIASHAIRLNFLGGEWCHYHLLAALCGHLIELTLPGNVDKGTPCSLYRPIRKASFLPSVQCNHHSQGTCWERQEASSIPKCSSKFLFLNNIPIAMANVLERMLFVKMWFFFLLMHRMYCMYQGIDCVCPLLCAG